MIDRMCPTCKKQPGEHGGMVWALNEFISVLREKVDQYHWLAPPNSGLSVQ